MVMLSLLIFLYYTEFVRKVYSILTVQLLSTIVMSSIYMFNDSIKNWVQTR